jgi:putative transposase
MSKAHGSRPNQKYKTCRRYNDAGHAHALTFCCYKRQRFLTKERTCQWLAEAIDLARGKHRFDLWAYVFMPEHVHLVICPLNQDYDVSKILATIKQSVTRKSLAHVRNKAPAFLTHMLDKQPNGRSHYRFWQRGGGFDRNLWSEKAIFAEIEYVHANPLRRKLCDRAEDWKWSSAADYAQIRQGPIMLNLSSLPRTVLIERH